jgi:hypothetical protein
MRGSFTFMMLLLITSSMLSCQDPVKQQEALDQFFKTQLPEWNRKLTGVIVADIFTPPVASRIYAYPNIAAYEVLRHMQPELFKSLSGRLRDLPALDIEVDEKVYLPLAGMVAFTTVAQALVYNGPRVQQLEQEFLEDVRALGLSKNRLKASSELGRQVGQHVLDWAHRDGYNERTALSGYTVTPDPSRWHPTPPDYMDAIEPHWNTIRPFMLDSANQFSVHAPTSFDTIPGSSFYEETMQVYPVVNQLDEEQLAIAKFWDCNPNISYTQGHVMYFEQQISPGGHWVHITAQVLEAENLSLVESALVLAKVSVTLADAFISCWDEKYSSSLVRPETYINRYIDQDWKPVLQTPAFPEHTSGHSVASASAAYMLTHLFGNNYSFIDSTEVPFGLPTRHFNSFIEASEEAAISRLYGGIHYRPAITSGINQGRAVAKLAIKRLEEDS